MLRVSQVNLGLELLLHTYIVATIKLVLYGSTTIFSDLILDWRDKAENSPPSKNASKREKREGGRERE